MKILVINSGSSSVKYKLFEFPQAQLLTKGTIERIGESNAQAKNHLEAVHLLFKSFSRENILTDLDEIAVIGHRVVHGGEKFKTPCRITKPVIAEIRKNIQLAPLHNPANLAGILACQKILPKIPQIAVFDTAFHQTIPDYAYLYPLPLHYYKKFRIRRYGFHGTSHHYVSLKAAEILKKPFKKLKLITIHLGNGCSISAVHNGQCIDTSMGFTPLEGLMMGTRSGDIDPAIIFFLEHNFSMTSHQVDTLLNKKSGLLGISQISNDMREITRAIKKGNLQAKLAYSMFAYRIKKYIGAYAAILGGIDACVFTAGIGENNPHLVRAVTSDFRKIFKKMPKILVIPTQEELMIAQLTFKTAYPHARNTFLF